MERDVRGKKEMQSHGIKFNEKYHESFLLEIFYFCLVIIFLFFCKLYNESNKLLRMEKHFEKMENHKRIFLLEFFIGEFLGSVCLKWGQLMTFLNFFF
jgi:hypothetical protein